MKLAIYGVGGMGREVMYYAQQSGMWEDCLFIVDRQYLPEKAEVNGCPVFASEDLKSLFSPEAIEFLVCTGEPRNRELMYNSMRDAGFRAATFVDPSVSVSPSATIEDGVIILKGTILSTNIRICRNTAVSYGVVVGHDSYIGEHCYIAPGVMMGGFAKWGRCSFGGIGSVIRDRVAIGDRAVVGQGTIVLKSVGDGMTVVGNPARQFERRNNASIF